MTSEPSIVAPALDLAVRIGCELVYDTTAEVPALVTMKPRYDALQAIRQESFHFEPQLTASEFEDDHLNIVYRLILKPGRNSLTHAGRVSAVGSKSNFQVAPGDILRVETPGGGGWGRA